ncbi:MAG TPA: LysM peptidoglycan-binding domain-containing protein [Thermoanaerobaculia bacterium]|nr:LysM peptidoglycan-binding domain-containing protein [Thermoanaerobaculia bacterium]
MSARFPAVVFAAAILAALPLAAAERPPDDLHWVGDHWTAWDPPQVAPGPDVHVIARGDTLWDLAGRFYRDPYLWPQLWERNQYILDAHWIYPGDPLVVGFEVAPVEDLTQLGEPPEDGGEEADGDEGVLSAAAAAAAPAPLGAESDIDCSGFIGELDEDFRFSVLGSEYDSLDPDLWGRRERRIGVFGPIGSVKYRLSTGDVIYLDGGRAGGMRPGELFTVVLPDRTVRHPVHRETLGRLYRYTGRVRVLSVQEESAIAEIVHTCDPSVLVGARLMPFEPEPVPLGRRTAMRPVNLPSPEERLAGAPVVLMGKDDIISMGQDHVVFIEGGADTGVTPGDVYTVYRSNRIDGMPPIVLGELAVLSVHARTSVAKVIESRYSILAGDRLEAK